MHAILQSVVGRPGPLIVEHKGDMIIEKCMIITNKHVKNINEKIEKYKVIQKLNKLRIVHFFSFRRQHLRH
jgi:propanediol utilization protein